MDSLSVTPSKSKYGIDISHNHPCSASTTATRASALSPASKSDCTAQSAVIKPKQSKSRNGCVTCKTKRLKCDESKPTCQQCHKRGVQCGGYKKEFKWRSFEESTVSNIKTKKSSPPLLPIDFSLRPKSTSTEMNIIAQCTHQVTQNDFYDVAQTYKPTPLCSATLHLGSTLTALEPPSLCVAVRGSNKTRSDGPPLGRVGATGLCLNGIRPSSMSGFLDISSSNTVGSEDYMKEITHVEQPQDWLPLIPCRFNSTHFSVLPQPYRSQGERPIRIFDIFKRPKVTAGSSEILLSHFDKHTCGIMSVKDGPSENPWRTLIWPMAQDSPALYHAISAMTAFHMSRERKELRVDGIEHMRKSIRFLAQGLSHGNIKQDAALATTLVLAFSEAFDRHTSTGFEHLRGARGILDQVISKRSFPGAEIQRFQFLYNVWVYLDVLARLTSNGEDHTHMNLPSLYGPLMLSSQIDPLLGCAATLFPLIGRAAGIVQRVRKCSKNSVDIISDAAQLQLQLINWDLDIHFEPPEDTTNSVSHCISTAEAYRWATLLYLHQAVPEIPSPTSPELAKKVMNLLASIPVSSRSCIVHIYPLLTAGCEALGDEERSWTRSRWERMQYRLWLGNVDKAWTVTKEVWGRRDNYDQQMQDDVTLVPQSSAHESNMTQTPQNPRQNNDTFDCRMRFEQVDDIGLPKKMDTTEQLGGNQSEIFEYEMSVRGKLHWLGVMRDWDWEVLLG